MGERVGRRILGSVELRLGPDHFLRNDYCIAVCAAVPIPMARRFVRRVDGRWDRGASTATCRILRPPLLHPHLS